MLENFSFSDQKRFIFAFLEKVDPLCNLNVPYERTTLAVYRKEAEKGDTSALKSGVRSLISDIIEITGDWLPERVAEVDAILREQKVATLSEVRQRHSRKIKRIVTKGRIGNLAEYYECKEVVDCQNPLFSPEDRTVLERALLDFEQKA